MLQEKMYVRCSIDAEYPDEPRTFIFGKIIGINTFSETASVEFYDLLDLKKYYDIPLKMDIPLSKLFHSKLGKESLVYYKGSKYLVVGCETNKEDCYYYYYLVADDKSVIKVCESEIITSINAGEISPLQQLKQYEFQNPMWYFGRKSVVNTSRAIDNAFYGFRVLSGCKIFLKPYQLKTVMRCLSGNNCRYMIADEVGLGKTIEAASVLKVYLSDKKNQKILICVPDALTEQWKTELAFKFRMFEGNDKNGNSIELLPMSKILLAKSCYDFVIIDEIHSILDDTVRYVKVMRLSRTAKNVIMLSATPVQSRKKEYHKLLSLIQPDKYEKITEEEFLALLELQNNIVRKVYSAVEYLYDYEDAAEEQHTEDTEELFEELTEVIEDIARKTEDKVIREDIKKLDYESDDFSIPLFEKIVAYICETYQLERCIIRNRRKEEDSNIRKLKEIPYEMDCDFNNTEFRIYGLLSEWIYSLETNETDFNDKLMPLITAFFSSSMAFGSALKNSVLQVPDEIKELAQKWSEEDKNTISMLKDILEDPYECTSRMVAVCDYIEQEAFDKKVLVFTHFSETHDMYKQAFISVFGEKKCAFFREGMSTDELELNTYRFQNNNDCHIMLSDETGGEGRNFQMADELICIDIPWSANTLEQRIGRLDRIGRDKSKNVVSAIVYSSDTVEHDLADIWNRGLNIFTKSQSGLEIIMNDIDNKIKSALANDFKYGLSSIVDDMIHEIKLIEKRVKEERHFDIAAYQYQSINKQIEKAIEKYNSNETDLFRNSMMSWASLAGFNGSKVSDDIVRFNSNAFSIRSAYNTMLIPPDMELMIGDRLNQMQNHIRILNGDREIKNNPDVVQGTFSRSKALKSDYLHFFAPGDELYDSIVNNAISAYKGKCSAFAVQSSFEWQGFIFNFFVQPDELYLLQNHISLLSINQYRGFISSDIISIPVAVDSSDIEDISVIKKLNELSNISITEMKYSVANFGKRSRVNDFLGIGQRYMISNLEWFKAKYPHSIWKEKVDSCYRKAIAKLRDNIKNSNKFRLKALKDTLNRESGTYAAAKDYFGNDIDLNERSFAYDRILEAFCNSKPVLDSVCYVRMIKYDRSANG